MEGLNRGIFEIFEIILVVSLFLVVSVAIIVTNQPNFIAGNLILNDVLVISNIVKPGSEIKLKYSENNIEDDFKITQTSDLILIKFDEEEELSKNFEKEKIKISQNERTISILVDG